MFRFNDPGSVVYHEITQKYEKVLHLKTCNVLSCESDNIQ